MRKSILLVLPLLYLIIFPSISHALGFEGIGVKAIIVLPNTTDDISSPLYNISNGLGVGIIASLGTIVPQIYALKAEVSAEYWLSNSTDFVSVTEVSYVSFNSTAKYYFLSTVISPFVGGGLAFILANSSSSVSSTFLNSEHGIYGGNNTDSSNSDTNIGFHLVGGINIPLGRNIKFVVEGKLAMNEPDAIHISGGIVFKL
jgi:hypothetical protein